MRSLIEIRSIWLVVLLAASAAAEEASSVIYPDKDSSKPQPRMPVDIAPRPEDGAVVKSKPGATGTPTPSPVRMTSTPTPTRTPTPVPTAVPKPKLAPTPIPLLHRVEKGDTLWKVSRQYGVNLSALKAANGLTGDEIKPGQVLKIPGKTASAPPVKATPTPAVPRAAVPAQKTTEKTSQIPDRQGELRSRFLRAARDVALAKVGYADDWTPPGEQDDWMMDCSNTTRYLYMKVTRMKIPRTASDQYYQLRVRACAWDVPRRPDDEVDVDALKRVLRVGDLLFWENTYKPARQPPITHVMIYLGTDSRGELIMAGSQSGGGESGNPEGGPDIYPFDPNKVLGGYRNWVFGGYQPGRFVAFGRPLALKLGGQNG